MFPLRDDNPRRGPAPVVVTLIVVNVAIFFYQFFLQLQSPEAAQAFVYALGSVPERITEALAGRYPLSLSLPGMATSIFLHGGWMHLIGNMWFLWIFGDNIEDELGHRSFLFFYMGTGLLASLAHYVLNPLSPIPAIGASGAISGVMGGYLVRFPRARVTTLIPIIIVLTTVELPAAVMLVYWFVIQFFSGASSIGAEGGGVAWWAHIGGFVAGAVWMRFHLRRPRIEVLPPGPHIRRRF